MCVLRTGDSRLRHGSNERDRSSSTERSSPVMLSAAKHLAADCDRPFAEFTLERSEGLRVTWCDCTNYQGLFFTIEPCLRNLIFNRWNDLRHKFSRFVFIDADIFLPRRSQLGIIGAIMRTTAFFSFQSC